MRVPVRGWIEATDKAGKSVDIEDPTMKKLFARLAIGEYYAQERLPLHVLKLNEAMQSAYLDSVNKRLTEKLTLGLRRKGFEIAGVHNDKVAAQQIKSLVDQTQKPATPVFAFGEAG